MIITFEFKPKTKFLFALISPLFIWILKLKVQALELQQLPVSPLLNNLPIPQHKNPLTLLNRAQPVRNHNRRPADLRPVQRLLHNLLRFSVQRRRRLGQHLRRRRHGPLGQSGPGEELFHALCLLLPKLLLLLAKLLQLLEGRWCCGRLWGTG